MAIKVKHEGNVTSRIIASAAGGKGRRQAEDAKLLASVSSRGGGGGGGGTGGGARGSAPTISAPTSSASLGSTGGLLSPTLTMKQRKELADNEFENKRDLIDQELDWKSGENKASRESAMAMAKAEQMWRSGENEKKRAFDAEQNEKEWAWRTGEAQPKRKWEDANANRSLRRIDLEKTGYSGEQILEIEKIDSDKAAIMNDPNLAPHEKAEALSNLESRRKDMTPLYPPQATAQRDFENSIVTDPTTGLRYRQDVRGNWIPMETTQPKPMSPQEIYESAYRDENGTLWISDNKGGIVPLQNTTPSEAKPDLQRAKYITSRVAELMDETNESNQKIIENKGKLPTRKEAEQIAMREYDSYTGAGAVSTLTDGGEGADFDYSEEEELAEAIRRGLIK